MIFALLWLDSSSAGALRAALEGAGLRPQALLSRFHLTVYHARRTIPGLQSFCRTVSIDCDIAETRAMVLVPGGENPRHGVIPAHRSLALRLTSRNSAIPDIQALRSKLTGLETKDVLGSRSPSSRKRNAFGARNYQPHLKICGPNNGSPKDLRTIGGHLRRELVSLRFTDYEVCIRPPSP